LRTPSGAAEKGEPVTKLETAMQEDMKKKLSIKTSEQLNRQLVKTRYPNAVLEHTQGSYRIIIALSNWHSGEDIAWATAAMKIRDDNRQANAFCLTPGDTVIVTVYPDGGVFAGERLVLLPDRIKKKMMALCEFTSPHWPENAGVDFVVAKRLHSHPRRTEFGSIFMYEINKVEKDKEKGVGHDLERKDNSKDPADHCNDVS
jgi:hypothetical protein